MARRKNAGKSGSELPGDVSREGHGRVFELPVIDEIPISVWRLMQTVTSLKSAPSVRSKSIRIHSDRTYMG